MVYQAKSTDDAALLCTVHSGSNAAAPGVARNRRSPAFASAPGGFDVCRFEAQTVCEHTADLPAPRERSRARASTRGGDPLRVDSEQCSGSVL